MEKKTLRLRPLSSGDISRLKARALADGQPALLNRMQMSLVAYLRAVAGLPVRPGTRALVHEELARSSEEAPTCEVAS